MRKLKQVICALSIVALAISGCKKDSSLQDVQSLSASDLKFAQMIIGFKHASNSNLKSGERMSVDSAVWYIEATANYTYGDGSKEIEETAVDSTYILLAIDSENKALITDVWNSYVQMVDSIRTYYQSLTHSEKQLIAIDVEAVEISGSNLVLKATSTFAVGIFLPTYQCSFDPNGPGWKPVGAWGGPNGGTCDGQYPDRDAATEIKRKITQCMPVPAGNVVYSEVETNNYFGGFLVPGFTGNTNFMGYYLYTSKSWLPGFNHCLTPEECNFYLNGTKHVINDTPANGGVRPDEKVLIGVQVRGWIDLSIPSTDVHLVQPTYGIPHITINPPTPL
jgi:hypothetical protein